MSHNYEKHTWSVGEVITKALIDRMETGIDNAVDKSGDTISGNLDFIDPQSSDATRQKGRIVWDDYTNPTTGISYGRLKIQQFTNVPNLITSGTGKGYYTYNEEGKPIVDTYSFPQRLCEIATNESGKTYRVFTSNGTTNGAAYWDSGSATDNDLQYGILPLKYGGLGFVPAANGALYVNTNSQNNKVVTVATLPVIYGGTGLTTVPKNYLLLGDSTDETPNAPLKTLAPGENGQVLKIVKGAPTWATDNTTPYPYTEYTSTTNNGITTATFTMNNRTVWNDGRVARIGHILQFFTKDVPIKDGDQNVVVTDFTTKYTNAIIVGENHNRFVFREHHLSENGVENYYLPAPTNTTSPIKNYDILTSKHYLPAKYGRLAPLKLNNTTDVRDCAVFGGLGAFDSRVVNQLSNNSNIVIPSNSDHVAQSQAVWVTGTFKTQYCYVTGNPPIFNIDTEAPAKSTITWGSLPALNLRYTKISNLSAQVQRDTDTNEIKNILLPNDNRPQYEDVTLASFRARHVTTGDSWKYRWPMGTERQAVIDVVTYIDDNFTDASNYGQNKRGNFAFHLPTCKWSEWVSAYNQSSASTKDKSFGVHYSILTTKNYHMYSDTITLKNDITIANSHQVLGTIQYQNFSFPDLDYQGVATLAELAEYSTLGGGLILSVRNKGGSGCEIWGYTNGNTTVLRKGTKIDFIGMHTIPETWNSDDND